MASGRVRPPVAGIWGFYPVDRGLLIREIERCFLDERFGPGRLPERGSRLEYTPVAGVAPHAGYRYSGPCAAHLYLELAENLPRVDTVVVIGTNHTGYGGVYSTTLYYEAWSTPLGEVPLDSEMVEVLLSLASGLLVDSPEAHAEEHSVEVQLPFLQYIYGDGFQLVPIVALDPSIEDARRLAAAIAEAAERLSRRIVVIASSDFTHHGPHYGYVVFTTDVARRVAELDEALVERVAALDTLGFYKLLRETGATVCGPGAIAAAVEYARLRGVKRGAKLCYYNSGMVTGDESAVVGYASIVYPAPPSR